jgi:hypothetical protein
MFDNHHSLPFAFINSLLFSILKEDHYRFFGIFSLCFIPLFAQADARKIFLALFLK